MKVLVVGGTGFLGGAIAHTAASAGYDVTILSRGISTAYPRPGFKVITCDRHADLSSLRRHQFDVVFDTCAFAPDAVARLLDVLDPDLLLYVLVSSGSVYGDYSRPGLSETALVSPATPEQLAIAASVPVENRSNAAAYGDAYGPLKRDCECVALDRLGNRALILRSGLLVGVGDYTDRLTWWIRRIDAGGPIPVPGPHSRPIQLIDVRDAAAFAVHGATQGLDGLYNLTGRAMPMQTLLETARRVAAADSQFVWLDEEHVLASGLEPWTEIPLWLPTTSETHRHFFELDVEKAYTDGLSIRKLEVTLADILNWDRTRKSQPLKCGISPERESLLLANSH